MDGRAEIVVIGSGPGGAVAAAALAEAGRDVLILEEGPELDAASCPPFSAREIAEKYRNGGLTVAFGAPKVQYAEGRVVGGGSEVNSGLYHRTPDAVLESWARDFSVEACSPRDLAPHFEACEAVLKPALSPNPPSGAARALERGARARGLTAREVPSVFDASKIPGERRSMSRTFLGRARQAGARLSAGTRARRLRREGGAWTIETESAAGRAEIRADAVFLACGAVQTPALLRRSGAGEGAGRTLALHPTIKLVALFDEEVNPLGAVVPSHQAADPARGRLYGCSISTPPHLASTLLWHPEAAARVAAEWRRMATFYAMAEGPSTGVVVPLPGFRDPLVRYPLPRETRRELAAALRELASMLVAAGARALYPTIAGSEGIEGEAGLARLPEELPADSHLITIHLFSSCRMGEDRARCVVDSFGRVHGERELYVCDASALCGAPGVNPQGSIMAFSRRAALRFLGRL